jgi:hypothetical protein
MAAAYDAGYEDGYVEALRAVERILDRADWQPDHLGLMQSIASRIDGIMIGSDGLAIGRKDMSDRDFLRPIID